MKKFLYIVLYKCQCLCLLFKKIEKYLTGFLSLVQSSADKALLYIPQTFNYYSLLLQVKLWLVN